MTTVLVETTSGELPLYDVEPDEQAASAVIVLQEAFGVNGHIEDVTRRVAAAGYRAVAPHLFHRTGDPELPYGDHQALRPHMDALTEQTLVDDLATTLAYLDDAGFTPGRVGVVGFCMGGSVTFLAAVRYRLGAAVTFYGGGVSQGRFGMAPLVAMAAELQTPWLGLFGDEDAGIPVDDVEALRIEAARAEVPAEIVRYAGAGHGFHCDARPEAYNEQAAKDGWARTLAWFDMYLASAG